MTQFIEENCIQNESENIKINASLYSSVTSKGTNSKRCRNTFFGKTFIKQNIIRKMFQK